MNVSYTIMAHPARAEWVEDLQRQLGPVPVAWAEEPYARAGFREPIWRTKRAALRLHTDAPFHCVIQDDALPCPGFRERVEALVEHGDYLYGLFFRQKRTWRDVNEIAKLGADFTVLGRILGPAIVVATHRIPDLIAFCDPMDPELGDDDRMKVWARRRGLLTYFPIPSLVDHRVGPSFIGHPTYRVAWRVAS